MTLLGSESITLKRKTGGSYINGIWTGESTIDTSINATVRNLTDSELQQLEEGERKRDPRRIISETELKLTDEVVIDSINYLLKDLQDNSRHGYLVHWQATAIKVKES